MNRSLFCIFINYLNVEVDQRFQVALMSKSLEQIPSLGIITYIVWTLMAFLDSSLILSSAKFHQKNPAQDTNILPGFDNLQNNEKKKKKHTKKATFPFLFFFLSFFNGDTTQLHGQVQMFLHQATRTEQLLVAIRKFFASFQREFDKRSITLLSNEYIEAGEQ